MKKYMVIVRQEDIEAGARDNREYCPIALALKRKRGFKNISIGSTRIYCNKGVIDLPPEAMEFIDAFDSAADVQPFRFQIETTR